MGDNGNRKHDLEYLILCEQLYVWQTCNRVFCDERINLDTALVSGWLVRGCICS